MKHRPSFESLFSHMPTGLITELKKEYTKVKQNFYEARFEPAELDAAKLCEVLFRILEWHTTGKYTPLGADIKNFEDSTKKFENLSDFNGSIRFHIPKIISALYKIRNKRGVCHIGGDVDPNHMDATLIVACSDWLVAELVRLFHNTTTKEAQRIVEGLIEKKLPIVWEVGNKKRILDIKLNFHNKTLAALYNEYPKAVSEADIFNWVEHSNSSVFRRDVLRSMHKQKLVEYDSVAKTVVLSPKGIRTAEEKIFKQIPA